MSLTTLTAVQVQDKGAGDVRCLYVTKDLCVGSVSFQPRVVNTDRAVSCQGDTLLEAGRPSSSGLLDMINK